MIRHLKAAPRWLKIWTVACWSMIALVALLWVVTPSDVGVFLVLGSLSFWWVSVVSIMFVTWVIPVWFFVSSRRRSQVQRWLVAAGAIVILAVPCVMSVAIVMFRHVDTQCVGSRCYQISYLDIHEGYTELYFYDCAVYQFFCRLVGTNTHIWLGDTWLGYEYSKTPLTSDFHLQLNPDRSVHVLRNGEVIFTYDD